jgi:2'-5' RNA ligase
MELIRTFISIDLPKRVQKEVKKLQDELPGFEGKRTEPENLHLTLKFLGEINEEKIIEVKKRLKEIKFKRFESEIDEIGYFSPEFIRIIWIHLSNCDELQELIDEKLKGLFKPEYRFMSHVTIARVKYLKNKNYFLGELKKIKIPSGLKFKVNNFELKKSTLTPDGPIYEILERYNLT